MGIKMVFLREGDGYTLRGDDPIAKTDYYVLLLVFIT